MIAARNYSGGGTAVVDSTVRVATTHPAHGRCAPAYGGSPSAVRGRYGSTAVDPHAASTRGFTLLEVLVAFVLLAASLGVLMQIFSGTMRNAERVRDTAQATALAQSLLAAAGIESRLDAGARSGELDGKYRWQVSAAPYALADGAAPATPAAAQLWEVAATVEWPAATGREPYRLTLSTLRLQGAPSP